MNAFYDGRNQQPPDRKRESWQEEQRRYRDCCYQRIEKALGKVATSSKALMDYLDMQARFNLYSPRNVLLIQSVCPRATQLADAPTWKAQGIRVKGYAYRQPILVLEPGRQYERDDGSIGHYYNVKKLYDISQTDAPYTPPKIKPIADRLLIKALIIGTSLSIKITGQMDTEQKALYVPDEKAIYVSQGLDADALFQGITRELCREGLLENRVDPPQAAFLAASAAYMVCRQMHRPVEPLDEGQHSVVFHAASPQAVARMLTLIRDSAEHVGLRLMHNLERFDKRAQRDAQGR